MKMFYKPKQIPNARNKIKQQLKFLGLKAIKPFPVNKANEHTYYSPCYDKKGSKYFFKARLWAEKISEISFRNEVFFYRNYSQDEFFKNQKILLKMIDSSIGEDLDWSLFEFEDGKTLSEIKLNQQMLKKIVSILRFFREIPDKKINPQIKNFQKNRLSVLLENYHPKKNKFERYLEETLERLSQFRNELPSYNQIKKIIFRERRVLMTAPQVFCHGDFNVSNMIKKNSDLIIVDWESVQKNNWAYDLANCYTHENFQPYRKVFLRYYLQTLPKRDQELFKESLRLMIILQIGYKLFPVLAPKLERKKEPKKIFSFWKKIIREVCNEKI